MTPRRTRQGKREETRAMLAGSGLDRVAVPILEGPHHQRVWASIRRKGQKGKFRLILLERPTFNEDCRLVAKVGQPLPLPEAKLVAQYHPLRPFAGLCLFGMEA
jgi:hypothetical protein